MYKNSSNNKDSGEDISSPKSIDNNKVKNKRNADSKDNTNKERKNLNISLQKRNLDNLNRIIDNWEEDGLIVSSEVCKSILFKNDFENNSYLQTFLSTFNLIKTSISNKDLFEKTQDEALTIALKNILNIKINAEELVSLLENDSYFKTSNLSSKFNHSTPNISSSGYTDTTHNINSNQNQENNTSTIPVDNSNIKTKENISINKSLDNNDKTKDNRKEKQTTLIWDIPEPIIKSNQNSKINEDINKKFDAFSYNI